MRGKSIRSYMGAWQFWLIMALPLAYIIVFCYVPMGGILMAFKDYSLIAGFPIPILPAVGLNEIRSLHFKKMVQMVTYAPYFISVVVMVGMLMQLADLRIGIFNRLITILGGRPVNFFGEARIFPRLYVWSGIWQTMGYSSIIYIAALAGVSR